MTNEVVERIAEKHAVYPANILISLQANRPGVNGEDSVQVTVHMAVETKTDII